MLGWVLHVLPYVWGLGCLWRRTLMSGFDMPSYPLPSGSGGALFLFGCSLFSLLLPSERHRGIFSCRSLGVSRVIRGSASGFAHRSAHQPFQSNNLSHTLHSQEPIPTVCRLQTDSVPYQLIRFTSVAKGGIVVENASTETWMSAYHVVLSSNGALRLHS